MGVQYVTPILNVSDVGASMEWFELLGWKRGFAWNDEGPVDAAAAKDANANFGSVRSDHAEIFLCRDGQGGRGVDGAWVSWWVEGPDQVDALHRTAVEHGMTIGMPPTDEPWGVREFHLLHPDGHTFRVGAGRE